ncbi:MAG: LCP family protein [Acidimicrobiales bacterium]
MHDDDHPPGDQDDAPPPPPPILRGGRDVEGSPPPPPPPIVAPSDDEPFDSVPHAPERRRRRWVWWAAAAAAVTVLIVGAFSIWALVLWGRIDRVDVSESLAPASGGGTNYLVVGTDSRDGISADNPNAGVILGDGTVSGERTDTVVVLRVGGAQGTMMMALPRDLWLPIDGGAEQRINTAFAGGPAALIRTVQGSLGIPIQHYVEVDFSGFLGLVDALGGITIPFENPAYDPASGLSVAQTGPVHLDADQALAYVRSRGYTEVIDGRDVVDGSGDLGRVQRQQTFLRAVFDEIGGTRNPFTLLGILDALAGNIRLDDDLGLRDAFGLARRLRGLDPETVELPTFPFTTSGGAAVLGLDAGADEVLGRFR